MMSLDLLKTSPLNFNDVNDVFEIYEDFSTSLQCFQCLLAVYQLIF